MVLNGSCPCHPNVISIQMSWTTSACVRFLWHTVDGRNPAPVDMVNIPLFTRVSYIQGGCLGFLFHQQYRLPTTGLPICHGEPAMRNWVMFFCIFFSGAVMVFGRFMTKKTHPKNNYYILSRYNIYTLQEINISHLGKRKIIFKYALSVGYVNSLEGIYIYIYMTNSS